MLYYIMLAIALLLGYKKGYCAYTASQEKRGNFQNLEAVLEYEAVLSSSICGIGKLACSVCNRLTTLGSQCVSVVPSIPRLSSNGLSN